jgi:hypothetical protein
MATAKGRRSLFFPKLFVFVGDHPEQSKVNYDIVAELNIQVSYLFLFFQVTCTYDSNRTTYPCNVCECPKELLSDVQLKHAYRSESKISEMHSKLNVDPDIVNKFKEMSMHPVKVHFISNVHFIIVVIFFICFAVCLLGICWRSQ